MHRLRGGHLQQRPAYRGSPVPTCCCSISDGLDQFPHGAWGLPAQRDRAQDLPDDLSDGNDQVVATAEVRVLVCQHGRQLGGRQQVL